MPALKAVVILGLAGIVPLRAQFGSSIQGTVTDVSQGVIPQATVTVTNTTTGVKRETATSAEGLYRVLSLAAGTYTIMVEKTGFLSAQREGVLVEINETVRADVTLRVGAVAEKVTVVGAAPLVETEQGRVSGQIDTRQVRDLPLNTRNVLNLLALSPGMTGRGLSGGYGTGAPGDSYAGESAPSIYASGQRFDANSYTLDDTSINSEARGGITNLTPNADSVQEVRVVSNNFSAVDGRNTGAQIQIISKSGTNEFHGGASIYHQNNRLASRNEFEAATPVFRRNLFGYTFGGPVIKNRLFFFTSYEGLRQSGGRASQVVVETPQLRDWVLQNRPNSIAAQFFKQFQPIADPTSGFRDVGSVPAIGTPPNTFGPADGIPDIGSARFVPHLSRSGNQFSGRADYELKPGKDRLYGNFYRTWNYTINGTIRPVFDLPLTETTTYGNLNYTHIFSPTQLNEARLGVMRLVGTPDTPQRLDIPQIVIPGMSMRNIGNWPRGWYQTNYQFKDIFSWIKSAHTLKIGGEVRRMYGAAQNTPNYVPQYDFSNILTFANDAALQMTRLVDPRDGTPGPVYTELRVTEWALFINDDWKLKRNLTVNAGLRYENYGVWHDKENTLRQLLFGQGTNYAERLVNAKVDFVSQFYPSGNLNFAPRLGFAWDVGGQAKTTVRGGYGIAYDRLPTVPMETYRVSPPLRATAVLGYFFGTPFTYSLGDTSKPYYGYPVDPSLKVGLDSRNGIKGARVALTTVDPNLRSPYTHNWFFGVQRDLGHAMVVEVNYIGSAGHRLLNAYNPNRYAGDLLTGQFHGYNPSFSTITMMESTSNSIYHGATVQVRRQFRQGFSLQGAYTFGKAIDDTDVSNVLTNYQDAANRRNERALAGYDVPQKLSLAGVWDLPFFRGPGALHSVLGGWSLSGFAILEKGRPLNVITTAAYPAGDFNADGSPGDRPNAPAADVARAGWSRSDYLTGLWPASVFPKPAAGANGNLGRNVFRGPGFAETDLSLAKRFRLLERLSIMVRADVFNAFNRVNLEDPVVDLANANFGKSVTTNTPRLYQLGARVEF